MPDETIADFFTGRPVTHEQFRAIAARIEALGPIQAEVGSQISFRVNRKFAWFWLYNVTKKNPNGVLHVMLALAERKDHPGVRHIARVGKGRWNHQIVIRSLEDTGSDWLGDLLVAAYQYGSG